MSQSKPTITPVEVSEYATITHQKAEVGLVTFSRDRVLMLLSVSGSISSNFLSLMIGVALSILIALKSGGIHKESESIFWLAFIFSLVLVIFFLALTIKDEWQKYTFRKELKAAPIKISNQPELTESNPTEGELSPHQKLMNTRLRDLKKRLREQNDDPPRMNY